MYRRKEIHQCFRYKRKVPNYFLYNLLLLFLKDFTDWKSSFETNTGSKYVKNCGAKGKSDNQTTEYYYCNRTGPCELNQKKIFFEKNCNNLR